MKAGVGGTVQLTSPSQRFFPFLQAVQARAPLFGIWPWLAGLAPGIAGEPFVSAPFVRRLFAGDSEPPLEAEAVGLSDIMNQLEEIKEEKGICTEARRVFIGRVTTVSESCCWLGSFSTLTTWHKLLQSH